MVYIVILNIQINVVSSTFYTINIFSLSDTAAAHSNAEPESAGTNSGPPTILITAPSRDDIYSSKTNMTIADAVKERRPSSTPIVVGRKLLNRK